MSTSLLLVDDHTLVRTGMRALLEASDEINIIGEASDGRAAVEQAKNLHPQIVLMDVAMPHLNGIEAARQIRAELPEIRVIMLSMHGDQRYLFEALKAGVSGYVLKDAAFSELLLAIKTVSSGKSYLSPPLTGLIVDDYARRGRGESDAGEVAQLSPREREVLQLIAEGKSSVEIAANLHISARTADTHRQNIMKKLNIRTIAGLTKFAIRHGLSGD